MAVYLRQAIEERNDAHEVSFCGCPADHEAVTRDRSSASTTSTSASRTCRAIRDLYARRAPAV